MNVAGKLRIVPLADPTEVAVCEPAPTCDCTAPKITVETTSK